MSAYAEYFRAEAEAHRATGRAARLDPSCSPVERESRGDFYDQLAAKYDDMAAGQEARV